MTAAFDIDDFDLWDNQEVATYQQVSQADGSVVAEFPVQAASLGSGVTDSPGGFQGGQRPLTTTWHVRRSTLPIVPERGDRLVTSEGTYVVTEAPARLMSWDVRWELTTQLVQTGPTATGGP